MHARVYKYVRVLICAWLMCMYIWVHAFNVHAYNHVFMWYLRSSLSVSVSVSVGLIGGLTCRHTEGKWRPCAASLVGF
jgi:hypothetical protein